MKVKFLFLLLGTTLLFSFSNPPHSILNDMDKKKIAEKIAKDHSFKKAVIKSLDFVSTVAKAGVMEALTNIKNGKSSEAAWTEFLAKTGFKTKENYFQKVKEVLQDYNSVYQKYMKDLPEVEKKDIMLMTNKRFLEKNATKRVFKAYEVDCLSLFMAGASLCLVKYNLDLLNGNPNAEINLQWCYLVNFTTYAICEGF